MMGCSPLRFFSHFCIFMESIKWLFSLEKVSKHYQRIHSLEICSGHWQRKKILLQQSTKRTMRFLMRSELIKIVHKMSNILWSIFQYFFFRYVGFLQFNRPNLIIKDIETIKNITIKDFDHFQNHVGFVDEDSDPLFGRNLFSLKGTIQFMEKYLFLVWK